MKNNNNESRTVNFGNGIEQVLGVLTGLGKLADGLEVKFIDPNSIEPNSDKEFNENYIPFDEGARAMEFVRDLLGQQHYNPFSQQSPEEKKKFNSGFNKETLKQYLKNTFGFEFESTMTDNQTFKIKNPRGVIGEVSLSSLFEILSKTFGIDLNTLKGIFEEDLQQDTQMQKRQEQEQEQAQEQTQMKEEGQEGLKSLKKYHIHENFESEWKKLKPSFEKLTLLQILEINEIREFSIEKDDKGFYEIFSVDGEKNIWFEGGEFKESSTVYASRPLRLNVDNLNRLYDVYFIENKTEENVNTFIDISVSDAIQHYMKGEELKVVINGKENMIQKDKVKFVFDIDVIEQNNIVFYIKNK